MRALSANDVVCAHVSEALMMADPAVDRRTLAIAVNARNRCGLDPMLVGNIITTLNIDLRRGETQVRLPNASATTWTTSPTNTATCASTNSSWTLPVRGGPLAAYPLPSIRPGGTRLSRTERLRRLSPPLRGHLPRPTARR